jgi:hypothetical protein
MTEGERRLCDWQYGLSKGSFYGYLFEALGHADNTNLARLALGFPEETGAYILFARKDGYWENLEKEYTHG